jgi:hypothetical protein
MWDSTADSNLAGYRVHCGLSSGRYDTVYDAGLRNEATVAVDDHGSTLYFAVTAYNSSGVESVPSNEVIYTPEAEPCAPTAVAGSVSVPEDQAVSVRLEGSDTDGGAIAFAITRAPGHGTLSATLPTPVYRPAPDFHGSDAFEYIVSHGANQSAPAVVSINVTPVNDRPTALGSSIATSSGVPVAATLRGADADGDPLTFRIVKPPAYGRLVGRPPELTYEPASSFAGTDSFEFAASDGVEESAPARVTIQVTVGNRAPVAIASSVEVSEDASVVVRLAGTDADGDALTYAVTRAPANGKLTGTAPYLTYTPKADFNGSDSIQFEVSDGKLSAAATVSLRVLAVNDRPTALGSSIATSSGVPVAAILKGADADGDPLTFRIVKAPAHGRLAGQAPELTYEPASSFAGTDSFEFAASDGVEESAPARVTIEVTGGNRAPVAIASSVEVSEDAWVVVRLAGTDADGDALTYAVTRAPANGKLTGTAPNLTYTPKADFNGSDSIQFEVSDGKLSAAATISLRVLAVNDAPRALAVSRTMGEDLWGSVMLEGSDPDGDALTFTVHSKPANGFVTGTPPRVSYKPKKDFNGTDTFEFTVSDGKETRRGTATINVTPANDRPVAVSRSIWAFGHSGTAITLKGTDIDGDSLTFAVTRQPAHGTLSGTSPNLVYTPTRGYTGADSFEFVAKDKSLTSAPGTISINVATGTNNEPSSQEDALIVLQGEATGVLVTGASSVLANDQAESGDTMTAVLRQQPAHGVVELRPDGTFAYHHAGGPEFADSFTYSASGSGGQGDETTVSIRILQVVDLRQVDQQLEFDFSVVPGVEYLVEYQDGTAEGTAWQELTRFTSEDEGLATVTDAATSGGAMRFYRVRCSGAHGELVTAAWGLESVDQSIEAVSPEAEGGLEGPFTLLPAGLTRP